MRVLKNKAVYEHDICGFKGKANSIIFPNTIQEIKDLVKLSELDIVPRGTGMSFVGGCVPNNSVVVDISKMHEILEIDASRKMVYVEAGVIISDLNQELERYGLEFPIQPLFPGIQTIGGIIALNSAGDRELKYGKTRNWIKSLEVVNGKGELIELSKTEASDFVGVEGLTGIIVRAKLRLTTKKIRTFSIIKSDNLSDLFSLNKELKLDHEVSMIELMSKKLSVLMGLENKYHLFIEYENNRGDMKGSFYQKFLKMKDKAYYTLASNGFYVLENPKFFMNHIVEFITLLEEKNIPYFSNLGSGIVYACFNPNEKQKYDQAMKLIKRLRAKPSYNLGIGLLKKDFLDRSEQHLIARIKLRNDPKQKLNIGKMINHIQMPEKQKKPVEESEEEIKEKKESDQSPEQELQEFIYKEKLQDTLDQNPKKSEQVRNTQGQFSDEEMEKIKKIAGGAFGK